MTEGTAAARRGAAVAFADQTMLVGIGAPKCGTSWLYAYLRDHPGVFMSPVKEMHVWNARFRPDLCADWNARFADALDAARARAGDAPSPAQARMIAALGARVAMTDDQSEYLAFFRRTAAPHHRAVGEITPGYALLRDDGLRALRDQHPRVRLLFTMRDPVERFWSALRMRQRMEPSYRAAAEFERAFDDAGLVERGRYDLTLEAVDRVFASRDVWIGFYETMFTPARIGALCAFAGVGYRRPEFEHRPNAAPAVAMTADQRGFARTRLDGVYRYCRARFGDRLPDTWMC